MTTVTIRQWIARSRLLPSLVLGAGLLLAGTSVGRAFTLIDQQGLFFQPSDVGPGESARVWLNNLFGQSAIGVRVTYLNAATFAIVKQSDVTFLQPTKGTAVDYLPAVQDQVGLVVIAEVFAPAGTVLPAGAASWLAADDGSAQRAD